MLGEKCSQEQGKVTGTRVIPSTDGGPPMIETSFMTNGKLYGTDVTDMGTYVSRIQPSGALVGEGQGVAMTTDGEAILWEGFGVGKPTGKGLAAVYRYSISFQTMSTKLAKLNSLLVVGEWEVDDNGNCKGQGWEWK